MQVDEDPLTVKVDHLKVHQLASYLFFNLGWNLIVIFVALLMTFSYCSR